MDSISISLPPARRVLDFGCGTGWVLAGAQKHGTPFCVGVDCSLAAIQAGSSQTRESSIKFAVGDGANLPFADRVFDVVVGHVSMPYMNTRDALREIYRVLAPGGCFMLTFHSVFYLKQRFIHALRHGEWKDALFMGYLAINGLLNHCSFGQTRPWWNRSRFETVNTERGVCATVRKAGFVLIATEHAPGRIFFAATARKPGPPAGGVLPAPGWAIYCPLSPGLNGPAESESKANVWE